ncbi:MAG: SDR family NAD(P)-dependent oxidoreductase [Pseudomonadota bacterium]
MKDPNRTLVVLGATSGVAHAYLRLVAEEQRFGRLILVGRNAEKLRLVADDLTARGKSDVETVTGELGDPEHVEAMFSEVQGRSSRIDECLLAYGVLGDQENLQNNLKDLRALLETNFVSAALWMEAMAGKFEQQSFGHAVIIGSVAGDRGRQSNYLYGATKAGLERICEGMAHRFAASKNIHVTLAKPGFIDTPMTAHIEKSGPLWATPEQVARRIDHAVKKRRVRIYTPWFWRFILLIVRALPIPVFHKTKM